MREVGTGKGSSVFPLLAGHFCATYRPPRTGDLVCPGAACPAAGFAGKRELPLREQNHLGHLPRRSPGLLPGISGPSSSGHRTPGGAWEECRPPPGGESSLEARKIASGTFPGAVRGRYPAVPVTSSPSPRRAAPEPARPAAARQLSARRGSRDPPAAGSSSRESRRRGLGVARQRREV